MLLCYINVILQEEQCKGTVYSICSVLPMRLRHIESSSRTVYV